MLKIRAHHIVCMKAFVGKGYSEKFVKNLSDIIEALKQDQEQIIHITGSCDDICKHCPNRLNNGSCNHEEDVCSKDRAYLKAFGIEPGFVIFRKVKDSVETNLKYQDFKSICQNCQWFDICNEIFEVTL